MCATRSGDDGWLGSNLYVMQCQMELPRRIRDHTRLFNTSSQHICCLELHDSRVLTAGFHSTIGYETADLPRTHSIAALRGCTSFPALGLSSEPGRHYQDEHRSTFTHREVKPRSKGIRQEPPDRLSTLREQGSTVIVLRWSTPSFVSRRVTQRQTIQVTNL